MAKYLDLSGLNTVMSNIFSVFQQTVQCDVASLQALQNSSYSDGDDITSIFSYNLAIRVAEALIAHKCVIFNGGDGNAFIPMSTAWAIDAGTTYEFGLVFIAESYNNFYANKFDLSVNKNSHIVTLTSRLTKTL